jgi:hypothetical protein
MGDKTIFQNSSTLEHIWKMESPPNQKSKNQYTNSERTNTTHFSNIDAFAKLTNNAEQQSTEALTHPVPVKVQTKHSTLHTQLSGTLACFVR